MKTVRIPAVCLLLASIAFAARGDEAPEYGPTKGTLLVIGGGSLKDTGILETFLRLAGGKDARLVVVPTAGGNKNADGRIRVYDNDKVVAPWKNRGFKYVRMLHTHDPKVADTEEFAAALTEATAVWFDGGRQGTSSIRTGTREPIVRFTRFSNEAASLRGVRQGRPFRVITWYEGQWPARTLS